MGGQTGTFQGGAGRGESSHWLGEALVRDTQEPRVSSYTVSLGITTRLKPEDVQNRHDSFFFFFFGMFLIDSWLNS